MFGRQRINIWIWLLALVLAIFVGNVAGEALSSSVPLFGQSLNLGFDPTTVNLLGFLQMTVGFNLFINAGGAIVGLLAILGLPR